MTTVICIGDPHIKVQNIPEVELFIDRVEALVQRKQPDLCIILGDILDTHERLHTLALNKAYDFVDRMRRIAPTYVLVGNHDMCLAKDTPILLWDGGIKMSQDITVNDTLIGDDGLPRKVQRLVHGQSLMYKVKPINGQEYTVSSNHTLSLKVGLHKSIFWDQTKDSWTVKWIDTDDMRVKSRVIQDREEAERYLAGIPDLDVLDVPVQDYMNLPTNLKDRLYGFRSGPIQWEPREVLLDPYILGMWLGDGCKDGSGFASADTELIEQWLTWAHSVGGDIVHTGQYNFGVVNSGLIRTSTTISDPKTSCYTCRACQLHISRYKRAPALACASPDELRRVLRRDPEILTYLTQNASREQIASLHNVDCIQRLIHRKENRNIKQVGHTKNPLRLLLKSYGVHNCKGIPQDYMVNDTKTRLSLLAGIIDTDGHVQDGRTIIVTQGGNNQHLISRVQFLARSLGFLAISKKHSNRQVLYISGDIEVIPTVLPRKKCLPIMNNGIDTRGRKCADKSRMHITVQPTKLDEYYGWTVDKNGRFLLGDFTVTHNCNNQQFLEPQGHWMNGMKEWDNVDIIDQVTCRVINDEKFIFAPYVAPGRFEEALETLGEEWEDASCIFAHQEFAGCKMGAIVSVEGDKWPLTHPHVISGHIHSRQIVQDNIYYTGSAMQHAFGESEKNIIAYLTFQDGEYEREEIDLQLPRKKIVYKDVEDVEDYAPPETEDQIKVTVSGVYDQFKAFKKTKKYKDLLDKGVKVIFKPKKLERKKETGEPLTAAESEETSFKAILHSIVNDQKNPYLVQAFELVVNGKEIGCDDVMFV